MSYVIADTETVKAQCKRALSFYDEKIVKEKESEIAKQRQKRHFFSRKYFTREEAELKILNDPYSCYTSCEDWYNKERIRIRQIQAAINIEQLCSRKDFMLLSTEDAKILNAVCSMT